MALEEYKDDMATCCRCSACTFVPLETVKGYERVDVCPSIARYQYRAYSGGGRLAVGMALLEKKIDYTYEKLRDVIYNCQMCGACDVSCKYAMDMEVLESMNEIRAECVSHGLSHPVLDKLVGSLRNGGPMVLEAKGNTGDWLSGIKVKDYHAQNTDTVYHVGCRTCYDQSLQRIARNALKMMEKARVDVGVAFRESCCGGRAYQMGYKADAEKQAKKNMEALNRAGVKTLVTGCAECYYAYNVLYDKFGIKGKLEVVHTSEYFLRLIQEGKLQPSKKVNIPVTYHDPCHLGRQGEPYIHWQGQRVPGQLIIFDPPKEYRRGTKGIYEPPRDLIKRIPGVNLVEMERIKEYAWCCGAGGGVRETNPDYAIWAAEERINEAISTGSKAIVSGCPGCESLFSSTIRKNRTNIKVLDIVELLVKSVM